MWLRQKWMYGWLDCFRKAWWCREGRVWSSETSQKWTFNMRPSKHCDFANLNMACGGTAMPGGIWKMHGVLLSTKTIADGLYIYCLTLLSEANARSKAPEAETRHVVFKLTWRHLAKASTNHHWLCTHFPLWFFMHHHLRNRNTDAFYRLFKSRPACEKTTVGHERRSHLALDRASGEIRWKKAKFLIY